jgi:hypothetical protein
MTNPATLLALAERCEQAAGPDRELDCHIHALIEGRNIKPERWIETVRVYSHMVPRYTASRFDAAVTLYLTPPEVIPSCPRKVCAAALRARAMAQPSSDT